MEQQGHVVRGISKSTLSRLPIYLTYLRSRPPGGANNISATAISQALNLGEVQVRKDLAKISDNGKPRTGYNVNRLINDLEEFLGYKDVTDAVIIGTGKLGRALLDYEGFKEYGLNIVAGFDKCPEQAGVTDTGKQVFEIDKLPDIFRRMKIQMGIITVPAGAAQTVCDILVENGVKAILNFAPIHLKCPDNVIIQNENLAASLAVLSNRLSVVINKTG